MLRRDLAHPSVVRGRDRISGDAGADGDPLRRQLFRQLDGVATRVRLARWLWLIAVAMVAAVALAAGWRGAAHALPIVAGGLAATAVGLLALVWKLPLSRRDVARRIERRFPDLDARLLAIVDAEPAPAPTFLETQLLYQVLAHSRRSDWSACVPTARLGIAGMVSAAGVFALATLFADAESRARGPLVAGDGVSAATGDVAAEFGLTIEPGDVAVERGTAVAILARFRDASPGAARLVVTEGAADPAEVPQGRTIAMQRNLADPVYTARLETVSGDLTYAVEFDGRRSREYRLRVFDYPAVERIDAVVTLPDYTGLEPEPHENSTRLTVVEGATVSLAIHVNKPGGVALTADDTPRIPGVAINPLTYALTLAPQKSAVWRIELVDAEGRRNRAPIVFPIDVVPNRRPDISVAFPARDLRASPLEELDWEGTVRDDFGVLEYGVEVAIAGRPPVAVSLGRDVPRRASRALAYRFALEEQNVAPDDLVAWSIYADDFAPDGTRRRTRGDLWFVEVRHFDEAFREGQAPPGGGQSPGGGGQGNEIDQLIEQQKQIVQATWRLARRSESAPVATDDVSTVADAQKGVLDHARGMEPNDLRARQAARAAVEAMTAAVSHLDATRHAAERNELAEAVTAEQTAYRALLSLKAREHTVVQSAGGGGGGGGSGRSSEQLRQLELDHHQNRYQTERKATPKEDATRREQLQILNRLRELARRQADANQKLRELEHELRLAKTEEERARIRRRLKRLREDQQELVRDLDELRDRMDRPENQPQMSDARQSLDETRSRLLQSSDELERGQASKALSSGQKAERDLNRLQEDFRRQTAPQFADAVNRLRQEARDLRRQEEDVANQLRSAQSSDGSRRSLRPKNAEPIERSLAEQRERLDRLMDGVREVVEQAESTEPLLSQKLYDAARKARDEQPGESLDAARNHIRQQRLADAARAEENARRGIEQLESGIAKAADSILGDESEALRRARDELADLGEAVRKELREERSAAGERSGVGGQRSGKTESEGENESDGGRPASGKNESGDSSQESGREKGSGAGGRGSGDGLTRTADASGSSAGRSAELGLGAEGASSNPQSASRAPQSTGRSPQSQAGNSGGSGTGGEGVFQPLTGGDFQQFSDRLRDVEEMLSDEKLKADVARIREQARSLRAEFKRHAREPNWDLMRTSVLEPLAELRQEIERELANRESRDSLVPLDRDSVPEQFTDLVRKYYERLGQATRRETGPTRK